MEDKYQNTNTGYSDGDAVKAPQSSSGVGTGQIVSPAALSSLDSVPEPYQYPSPQEEAKPNLLMRLVKRADVVLAILLVLSMAGVFVVNSSKGDQPANYVGVGGGYDTQNIPLDDFALDAESLNLRASTVIVNGLAELNGGLVVTPSLQPSSPKTGQIYYDNDSNNFAYYNGTQFIVLGSGVESVGSLTGQVTLGGGLAAVGNQLVNAGVLSLGGRGGAIVLGDGLGMAGNALQNTGVLNVIAGTDISVTNDGNGNFTVSNVGAGTGTVTSGGGTAGNIPLYTGAQNIEDSIVTQTGLTVTITGDLSVVTGGLSLSNALTVGNGGTGATSLAANGVIVGNGTSAFTSVAAGGAGMCLLSTAGAPTWGACPGGSGVSSLNGLTGALSVANASAAGSTITIDDATTVSKGIASFNSTNFTVGSGAVNTIQNINSGATPTFAGVNTNSITPSAALTVGSAAQTLVLQGDGGTVITATSGANTTTVGFNAPSADVNINFPALSVGSYDVCTTSGNCLGGGGGGANTALSNLASVAINTTLLPGSAGGVNLGSATLPFGDIFLAGTSGTPGTNNFRITGASTGGTRTITLPNASGTVCIDTGNCAGTGTGVTVSSAGTIGTLPVFTAAQTIADSLVSQSGGTVTVNGHLSLSAGNQYRINGTQISSANLSNDSNLAKLSSSQTFTGNTNAFQNGINSTNAFNVQNAAGTRILTVDSTNGEVELGIGSTLDGRLVFNNVSNANTVTVVPGTPTGNRTLTLPDADGIICTDSGNCAGAGATLQTAYNFSAGGTTPKIKVDSTLLGIDIQDANTTIGANLFNVRESNAVGLGQVMFGVGSTGQVTLQNGTNSTTAIRLLTDGGTSVLTGDTTNGQIILGQSSTLNGTLVFNNSTNVNQITLTTAVASGPQTITLPNATGTVCLTSGNCAGVGGTGDILQGGNSFTAAMTIGTNDAFDVNLETSGVTRLTLESDGSQVTLASNVDLVLQGASAYISNRQASVGAAEAFGAGAAVDGNGTAIGNGATAGTGGAFGAPVALGYQATALSWGTAVGGQSSNTGQEATALGQNAIAAAQGVALGASASTAGDTGSIAIGFGASTTASNQLVFGSTNFGINHAVIGNGVTNASPSSFTLQGTSASGIDVAGATVNIAGGQGTGSAFGGSIDFKVSAPGVSGSSLNALTTVASIGGATGATLFQNAVNSTQAFRIAPSGGGNLVVVDTVNSRVGIALGGSNTPNLANEGLEVKGAIRISGTSAIMDTYTTPGAAGIGARLSVVNVDMSASQQVIAVGVTAASDANSRGITVLDARASAHQPSIAVISPNENEIGGFSWDGGNSAFLIKNSASGSIGLNVGGTTRLSATTTGVDVTGLLTASSLGAADTATYLCRNSTNQFATCNTTGAGAAFVQGGNSFGAAAVLGTNDANDLAIERNNATVLTVGASNVTFASNIDLILQGASAYISNQQGQSSSEAFGNNATVSSSSALAVGNNATATGQFSTAVGDGTVAAFASTALGRLADASGQQATALGAHTSATFFGSIAIGEGATTTAANQLVVGNTAADGSDISQVYIGSGVTDVSPTSLTIQGTGGSGLNVAGASVALAAGKSTGNASGGNLNFQVSAPSGSGSSLNALTTVASLSGANGSALFKNATNSASAFQVQNSAGGELLGADTTSSILRLLNNNNAAIATGGWTTNANDFASGRFEHASVTANGYVYVIAGNDNSDVAQSTVYYAKLNADGSIGAWATTTALPQTREELSAVTVNGYIYAIGGRNSVGATQSTVYYAKLNADGTVGTWNTTTALTTDRSNHSSVTANGFVYVLGGDETGGTVTTVNYARANSDGTLGAWNTTTAFSAARRYHASTIANGYVYSLGGAVGGIDSAEVAYAKLNTDGTIGSWSTTNALPDNRANGSVGVLNGYIYHMGGQAADYADVFYAQLNANGTVGSWTQTTDMNVARRSPTAVTANGRLYAIGGENGTALASQEYASPARVTIGGALDLVSLAGENLAEGGSGGNLTAGNTHIAGLLTVTGNASFRDGATVSGAFNISGTQTIQTPTNTDGALKVINSAGNQLFNISTVHNTADLITNGSLENDTTGWVGKGSATISRITSQQYVGLASLQTDTTAAIGDGAKYNIQLTPSTQYTVSFYAKLSSGTFSNMSMGYSSDGAAETDCKTNQQPRTTGWTSFNCTFTTAGTVNASAYFYWEQAGATARTVYVDALQLVPGADIGAYYDGKINTGGLVFSGPVAIQNDNNSTSAFQVQSATGTSVFGVDATNNRVGVNLIRPTAAFEVTTIGTTSPTAIFNQSGSSTEDILQLSKGSSTTANVTHDGLATFQNLTNSATAFRVLASNATFGSGVPQFVIDTSASRVYIGNPTADSTGALLVLDTKDTSGDPTGVDGAMYYNSNMAMMRCYFDGKWRFCNDAPSLSWGYNMAEEFIVNNVTGINFGQYSWTYTESGTGAIAENVATTTAGRPGILELRSSGATSGAAIFMAVDGGSEPVIVNGGDEIETAVYIPTLSDGTNEFDVRAGLCDVNLGDCVDGVYFEYDRNTSTNWSLVTANNSTRTRIQSSTAGCAVGGSPVAVTAAGWVRLKMVINSAASQVSYYINGTFVGCITANIPTARATSPLLQLYKSGGAGTTLRSVQFDYFQMRNSLTTAR